ncbi:MAG TPA: hypothetical protein VGD79_14165, partial [Thermoanaerobaculia bacterium]
MPPYDDRLFVPPAPVLNARLRNPLAAVKAAGIQQTGTSYELQAFDGRSHSAGVKRWEFSAATFSIHSL